MKVWDTQSTIMLSIGICFGILMIFAGVIGGGIVFIIAALLVAYMSVRNIKRLNKQFGWEDK